jgi:hypothetical protein
MILAWGWMFFQIYHVLGCANDGAAMEQQKRQRLLPAVMQLPAGA